MATQKELFLFTGGGGGSEIVFTAVDGRDVVTISAFDGHDVEIRVVEYDLHRAAVGQLFNGLGSWLSDGGNAIEIEPRERMAIFGDIHVERQAQDAEHGGPDHDDEHSFPEWLTLIDYQMQRARVEYLGAGDGREVAEKIRSRCVKMAALAVASVEAIDRAYPRAEEVES